MREGIGIGGITQNNLKILIFYLRKGGARGYGEGATHQNLTIFSVIFSLKIVLLVGRTYDTSRSLGKGDSDWWDK